MLNTNRKCNGIIQIVLVVTLLIAMITMVGCGQTNTVNTVDAKNEFYNKIKGTWVNKELCFIHDGQTYFNMMIFDDRGVVVNIVHPIAITGYELRRVSKISEGKYKLTLEFVDGEKKGQQYQQEIWFDNNGEWSYPEHADKKFSLVTRNVGPDAMEKAIKDMTKYCKKHKKYN